MLLHTMHTVPSRLINLHRVNYAWFHYLVVQVRANMGNFPNTYERWPTAHRRPVGSRWLPDNGFPTGDKGLVDTHYEKAGYWQEGLRLQTALLLHERGNIFFKRSSVQIICIFWLCQSEFSGFSLIYTPGRSSIVSEWAALATCHITATVLARQFAPFFFK